MSNKKEFVNVLLPHVRIITADYKGNDEGFERKVQRKRALIFGLDVAINKSLKVLEEEDIEDEMGDLIHYPKRVSFPKRIDKTLYTTKETKEDYIYIDFSGSVKVLDENSMTRTLGVIFDKNYMNAEYSDVTLNVSLSYNEEAKKYIARINTIRITKACVITEINNYTFEDENEFTTVTTDGEIISSIEKNPDVEVIEG